MAPPGFVTCKGGPGGPFWGIHMIGANLDTSKLFKGLRLIDVQSKDWRIPFRDIGLLALKVFLHRFEVGGPGWAPNKKGTRILVKTGRLMRSFSQQGNPENLFRAGCTEGTFGSRLPYAKIIQTGGIIRYKAPKLGAFEKLAGLKKQKRTSFVVPPRPIVVPPDSNFQIAIGRISYDHFTKTLKRDLA